MKRLTYALSLLIVAAFFSCEEQDIVPGQASAEPTATTTQHRSSAPHRPSRNGDLLMDITDPDNDPEYDAEEINANSGTITDPDDDPEYDAEEIFPEKPQKRKDKFK